MDPNRRLTWAVVIMATIAPIAVGAALIPARGHTENTNLALVLVVVVVAAATLGRRAAAVLAALSAALSFDFFHTLPYYSLTINAHDDAVTAVLLLVVGVAVGELAVRSRRHLAAAVEGSGEIARIHGIAEMVAAGVDPNHLALVVGAELTDLLLLRECQWEPAPYFGDDPPRWRLDRDGTVVIGEIAWEADRMGFPSKPVDLTVSGHGRTFGRYHMTAVQGVAVPLDRRIVAVALADQVAAAFAAKGGRGGSPSLLRVVP
jgi:hypothetical protein